MRNATTPTFEKLTLFTLDLPLEGLVIPFGLKDKLIRTLRDLNEELQALIKGDLLNSYFQLSTTATTSDRLYHLTRNSNDQLPLVEQQEQTNDTAAKKSGKGKKE